jgi:TonB family protein
VFLSVRVIVDANGNVTATSIVPPAGDETPVDASLQSAAIDAARLWKYRPSTLNGKAVESESTITFNFQ